MTRALAAKLNLNPEEQWVSDRDRVWIDTYDRLWSWAIDAGRLPSSEWSGDEEASLAHWLRNQEIRRTVLEPWQKEQLHLLVERFPRTAEVYWARRGSASSSSTAGYASEELFGEYRPMQSPLLTRRSWQKLSATRILDTVLLCRETEDKRELEWFRAWKKSMHEKYGMESGDESSSDEEVWKKNGDGSSSDSSDLTEDLGD